MTPKAGPKGFVTVTAQADGHPGVRFSVMLRVEAIDMVGETPNGCSVGVRGQAQLVVTWHRLDEVRTAMSEALGEDCV